MSVVASWIFFIRFVQEAGMVRILPLCWFALIVTCLAFVSRPLWKKSPQNDPNSTVEVELASFFFAIQSIQSTPRGSQRPSGCSSFELSTPHAPPDEDLTT